MPTSTKIKKALFKALPDSMEGTIVELGSGWGTLALPLARRYSKCQIIAYELSPLPYAVSCLLKCIYRQKNLEIKRVDFFSEPLQNASMAICYLYPGAMKRLKEKFEKEGHHLVVSHTFSVPGWTPIKTVAVHDLYNTKIYFY